MPVVTESRHTTTTAWPRFVLDTTTEVTTQFGIDGDAHVLTAPDGTIYKERYAGTSAPAWQRGLVLQSEVWSAGVQRKLSTISWTQDNPTVNYKTNPRVTQTIVADGANVRKTTIDYSIPAYAQYGLPYFVTEYAADGQTELRRTYRDYNLSQPYLDQRIIGLVAAVHLTDASGYQAKVTYGYDDPARLSSQATTATMHDQNYHGSFYERGNVTSVTRWDVTDINNAAKALTSQMNYNSAGWVISTTDPAGHTNSVSYSDSFSDGNNTRNTFAYPTTLTDADNFSSSVQYNFDFGAKTRVEGPPPQNQPNGIVQTFAYDPAARLERVTTLNNGAYTRYVYGPYWVQSFSTVNTIADEAYSITTFDGVGRAFTTTTNHPGSAGGYKLVNVIFDRMGRPFLQSNPTEVNSSWLPAGDDAVGVRYSVLDFDWQGRTTRKTHPDGAYAEASYNGCGCAGGEVVTLTDEVNRQQKVYSDVLGRSWKTEVLNWPDENGNRSVYSAAVKVYNARDQITHARQYAGLAPSDASSTNPNATCPTGTCQETLATFDGYGRLHTKHVPEQNAGTATVYAYNPDNTIYSVTDARGASATYNYNNRHLVTNISYQPAGNVPDTPDVSFEYDAVGNRKLMTDGLGSVSYNYNQLSRMTSETRTFNGVGSFTLSYDYNLAGELKRITDPTNSTIEYGFDSIGRLSAIAGGDNLYAGVATYATGFSYRASGGIKGLTYGNNYTLSASYDSRLRPSQFQVTTAGGQADVIKNDYSYYADGSPKYMHNWLDERFDRAYGYDHRAMLKQAFSGSEARDFVNNQSTPGATGPYWQIYQNDAFGNMTQRDNRFWSQSDVYAASYSNHRRTETGYQYDADGNLLADPDVAYGYDVAGNNISLAQTSGGLNYATSFDGAGQMVKKVQTNFGTTVAVTYYVRSSVLGGRVITELGGMAANLGQKITGYVFAGGEVLARQQGGMVAWQHQDPLSGSRVESFSNGASNPLNQLDPMGVDVGFEDPFISCCIEPPSEPEPGIANLLAGYGIPDGRCTLDGMAIDCGWAMQLMERGAAVPCPNNDCGPRVMNTYDRNGNFLGRVLSQPFQAFADGYSGFLPPGARYQGGGQWVIPGSRPSTPPSRKPGAPRPGAGAGNRNPDNIGDDEGPGGVVTGRIAGTVQFRHIGFGEQDPTNARVPLTNKEIYEARRNIRDLLQNPICNNFIKGMLEEFGKLPQGVFSLDLVNIFGAVRAQSNGGLFRDVTQSGSFAYAFGSLERGNATIAYRNSLDGGDGAHETMHVAARTGYGFSHQQMAQAAMSSAQAMGMVTGSLPNPNDSATTTAWDSANSQFFDRIFFQACVKGWIR